MTLGPLRARLGWFLGGAAAAALLAQSAAFDAADRAWADFTVRAAAASPAAATVAVVDLDEASIRELAARLGPWPYARDVHAALARQLLDLGARAVAFNFALGEARDGDEALRGLARSTPRVVLGADVRREAAPAARPAAVAAPPQAWRVPPGVEAPHWATIEMPSAARVGDGITIGVLQVQLDSDGKLRCLPLMHRVGDGWWPSLPLAALAASLGGGDRPPRLDAPRAGWLSLGDRRWPVNGSGCLTLRLPERADAVPVLSYAEVLAPRQTAPLGDAVRGRTVFVGSPSLLDTPVFTPRGQVGATLWLAMAAESLQGGHWLRPRHALLDGLFVLAALAPAALLVVWPGAGGTGRIWRAHAAALALLLAAAAAALLAAAQPVALPAALLVLACGAASGCWHAQRESEERRRAAAAERAAAERANRAKSEFLAHMSHEIRTPLNALLGVAQLLAETPMSALQRRYVETFNRAGAHLSQLVDDVLDLSRIDAGGLQVADAPVALRDLADEVSALFESHARSRGLAFAVRIDPGLPAVVRGDRHRLRQVLVNLLGNAIKFTQQGGVTLTLRPLEGGQVEFEVRDSGIGIAAERLATIFDPFVQADAGVASRFGGSGLGLAIARRLVDAMGGEITVDSREGVGTTMRVRLPMPTDDESSLPTPLAPVEPAAAPQLAGRRLLVAEDNEFNLLIVEAMLKPTGITIDVARDGRAAVEAARARRYDAVLLDLQMPLLDGHGAAREIRAAERAAGLPPVPLIVLSANSAPEDIEASRLAGCDAHLRKPIDRTQLLAMVCAHVGRHGAGAPFATDDLLQRFGGDERLHRDARRLALAQLQQWEARYEAAAALRDVGSCRRLAHDLKGVSAALGAMPLADAAGALEQTLAEGRLDAVQLDAVRTWLRVTRQQWEGEGL